MPFYVSPLRISHYEQHCSFCRASFSLALSLLFLSLHRASLQEVRSVSARRHRHQQNFARAAVAMFNKCKGIAAEVFKTCAIGKTG
mmetsp:Transcript_96833/g.202320  ORF Transcript_96833/g.202320 Transcript_96833/m.202320 type:complete len:86 (-) Transcript_96833:197-454(-)